MQRFVMIALAAALAASPAAAQDNNMTANADMAAANAVDANAALPATVDANGVVMAPDANLVMAPAPAEQAPAPAPAPARRSAPQGFPWGAIGLVGLVGLLGRRRSRD